jgi:TonB family protein
VADRRSPHLASETIELRVAADAQRYGLQRMTTIFLLQLALSSALFCAGGFQVSAQGKDPSPTPSTEEHQKAEGSDDPIYSAREVDVRAKVLSLHDDPPSPGSDCRGRLRLLVMVRAVLRKSGKVTEVELIKGSGCSRYDTDAIRAVQNLKFDPALKDNRPVSQYQKFEFLNTRF